MGNSVFKTRSKPVGEGNNKRFIGALVPNDLFLYIMLHNAATGNTKTAFMCDALKESVKELRKTTDEEQLITNCVNRAQKSWNIFRMGTGLPEGVAFRQFTADAKKELISKGVPRDITDRIIQRIKE